MTDNGIEYVLEASPLVKPRRSRDEQAQAAWEQILSVAEMLDDMVKDGARVRISRMQACPDVDPRAEMVRSLASKVGRILADAEIVDA